MMGRGVDERAVDRLSDASKCWSRARSRSTSGTSCWVLAWNSAGIATD
jgi:hypothetical protein